MSVYLDHAATTTMTDAARGAVARGMAMWANPSSPHAAGRAARAALEEARGAIGAAYDWDGEVLLTSGASESLAIALGRTTLARRCVTAVEHDAVFRAAPGTEVLPVGADGLVELPLAVRPRTGSGVVEARATDAALSTSPSTGSRRTGEGRAIPPPARSLVCVQWCNSETGVRQPIPAIARAIHAAGGALLLDAAQMPPGADPKAIAAADLIALSAHKHGGPPGAGALLVRDLSLLDPTGGQERGYRPGTENLPAVLGHAAALAEPIDLDRLARLRARLDDAIARSGGEVVAAGSPRHPAIASYRLAGVAAAVQLIRLDLAGFQVSAGSACASGSMKPSHVLAAMGWDETASREVIRVSLGRSTGEAEVEAFIAAWRSMARATALFAA